MYGMFQTPINSSSEIYRHSNLSWMDSNIHQAAAAVAFNAAASFNAMQNLPSFGDGSTVGLENLHGNDVLNQQSNLPNPFGSPSNEKLENIQSPQSVAHQGHVRSYSQSTTSTSHTPQSAGHTNQSQKTALSPSEGQSPNKLLHYSNYRPHTIVPSSMEGFTEFDLQDFEELLMDKPTTSFQTSQSNPANLIETTSENNQPLHMHYRVDELVNADMELDRLVSLVASQNSGPTLFHHQSSKHQTIKSETSPEINQKPFSSSHPVSSESLQFTPPDSPSTSSNDKELYENKSKQADLISNNYVANTSSKSGNAKDLGNKFSIPNKGLNMLPESSNKSARMQRQQRVKDEEHVLILKKTELNRPKLCNLALARRTSHKIPIYKRDIDFISDNNSSTEHKLGENRRMDDAYSFEDDDEKSNVFDPLMQMLQRNKHPAERKEINDSKYEEQHQTKLKRKTKQVISTATVLKPKERINTVYSILIDRIRRRKVGAQFITSEAATDDHAVLTDIPIPTCTIRGHINENIGVCSSSTPSLPKLVIRLPKKEQLTENEPCPTIQKKKKRKKKRERDIDWTETKEYHGTKPKETKYKEKRKKEGKLHKHRKYSTDESSVSQQTDVPTTSFNVFGQNTKLESDDGDDCITMEFLDRLQLFGRPTERPKRGTFLLPKEDLYKPDCPLWRIDNQSLLQKYLPIQSDGTICYQNSSTYSGWCEHYVDDFMAIKVEYVKQSRSENIVRPIYPLQDLFPAINFFMKEAEKDGLIVYLRDYKDRKCASEENCWNFKEQFRNHANNFIFMMLKHATSLQFIQSVKQNNDWNYLCALTEIESKINRALEKIRTRQLWLDKFVSSLQLFPQFSISLLDIKHQELCQACSSNNSVTSVVQLFTSGERYDYKTMVPNYDIDLSTAYATDFYVCTQCEHLAILYHKTYHLQFEIFKACEEKLENVSSIHPELSSDEIVSRCFDDKKWINKLTDDVMGTIHAAT